MYQRTMSDQQLDKGVSMIVREIDKTVRLGKYCLDQARKGLPAIITVDDLNLRCTGEINLVSVVEYIEQNGYSARIFNYRSQQQAIEVGHK